MAYSYEIPVSYTIGVSLASNPTGLAGYNTNSIAIFSNETAGFSENYQAYISADAVAKDFGSSSLTYKMAQALFTPVPNFKTGGGVLYVFPYSAINATSGTLTTADISANVGNFASVTDGILKLTIDGTATEIQGLDFSSVTKLADIVQVLNNQNLDVYIEVVGNTIKFTSKRFGTGSSVTISAATGTGTDLNGNTYLNGTGATAVTGTDASGESLSDAVAAALQQVYFGGVLTTQYIDDTELLAVSTALQSKDVVYYEVLTSLKNIAVTGAAVKSAGNDKTRLLAYSVNAETAKIAIATYATIAKSVNYAGSDTANTMNLKTLTGVSADTGLSDTYVLSAAGNGVDIYGSTGGISVVYSNSNNGYTDDIENNLAFKKAIEVAGWNYLRQTNTKIPQTEAAMTGLKSVYADVCNDFLRNGAIGAGAWNSAIPFGDPEAFKNNIAERGYYIYSTPVALQSQVDREARKAPLVQIALKRTGAIHFSDIIINVEA